MDSNFTTSTPESHPEATDFLSLAGCTLQCKLSNQTNKMDDADLKPPPPWKSNDVKSFIWMQLAMHPELNYIGFLRKKWVSATITLVILSSFVQMSWKIMPFENMSIKKWLKDIKAEVHASVSSMAGVAATFAAIATEKSENDGSSTAKEADVVSAVALVVAQCAKVAEAMGARKEQLSSVIGSAMNNTSATLKGEATLKERSGCCKKRLNGTAPVMPIEDNPVAEEVDTDFDKYRSMLAIGSQLTTETPDEKYKVRSVCVILNSEAKVLQMRKLSLFKNTKESIILDMYAELCKESEAGENGTGYLILLTTTNYQRYKTWATTINHMLMVSTSFMKYHPQYYMN
ncbi:unnamed protein product [Malus baccata var. baccata]